MVLNGAEYQKNFLVRNVKYLLPTVLEGVLAPTVKFVLYCTGGCIGLSQITVRTEKTNWTPVYPKRQFSINVFQRHKFKNQPPHLRHLTSDRQVLYIVLTRLFYEWHSQEWQQQKKIMALKTRSTTPIFCSRPTLLYTFCVPYTRTVSILEEKHKTICTHI